MWVVDFLKWFWQFYLLMGFSFGEVVLVCNGDKVCVVGRLGSLWEETFKSIFLLIFFSWVCSVLFSDTEIGLQWFVSPALSFFSRINLLQLTCKETSSHQTEYSRHLLLCLFFVFVFLFSFNGLHGCWHVSFGNEINASLKFPPWQVDQVSCNRGIDLP